MKKSMIVWVMIMSGGAACAQTSSTVARQAGNGKKQIVRNIPSVVPGTHQESVEKPQYPANRRIVISAGSKTKTVTAVNRKNNPAFRQSAASTVIKHPVRIPDRKVIAQNRKSKK